MMIVYFELCRVPPDKLKYWIGLDPVPKDNPNNTNIRIELDTPFRRIVVRMREEQAVALFQALSDALTARERKVNIPRPPWKKRPSHFEHNRDEQPPDDSHGSV